VATLRVTVVSPEREVFSGRADMVVARGVDGEVGILAGHAPMLIELAIGPVRLLEGETETGKVLVDGGFLHVTPGEEETRVDVLAEHALLPAEVDVESARRRVRELQDRGDAEAELAGARMRAEHGTA
jgi:F-type H+-transporting ATPase subunit epsilon